MNPNKIKSKAKLLTVHQLTKDWKHIPGQKIHFL